LGFGFWVLGKIPNPQSPIPNPQSPLIIFILYYFFSNKNYIKYSNKIIKITIIKKNGK